MKAPDSRVGIRWDNDGVKPSDLNSLFDSINSALPQTQCRRCGYADCAAYARAIMSNQAGINQCPPGGAEGIRRLASITGQPLQALNPHNGLEGPRTVAVIDESWCIGCTLCIKACPVDAIIGSNKLMHTVIESSCTGCALCLPACPVDCIGLENVTGTRTGWSAWSLEEAQTAQARYDFHRFRGSKTAEENDDALGEAGAPFPLSMTEVPVALAQGAGMADERKRAVISAALERSRVQRALKAGSPPEK